MSFLQKLDRMTQPFGGYCKGGGGGGNQTTTTNIDPEIRKRVTPALDRATEQYEAELGGLGQERYKAGLDQYTNALGGLEGDIEGTRAAARGAQTLGTQVAGQEGRFGTGLGEAEKLARDAISGQGVYDNQAAVQRQLANQRGNLQQQAAAGGALTSARQQRAQEAALADSALGFQQARQAQAAQGAQALLGLGQQAQQAALTGQQLQAGAADQLRSAGEASLGVAGQRRDLAQGAYDTPHESLSRYFGYLGNAPQGKTQETQGGGGGGK